MKLSADSIDFAKEHICKYWDSDFFPKQDCFNDLWKIWDKIKEYLENTEISDFDVSIPRIFAAPKSKGGFRIVHQLEPLNAIIYTALGYMIADKIEQARQPQKNKVACSYRISVSSNGDFFSNKPFYKDFLDKSLELSKKYKFILQTDITDFYNQIYVHRLQNAIEMADSSLAEVSKEIEKFIMRLNSNSTKGIPVGPAASIVFSEALMIDIDNFILDKGFHFTRYVDDIRIFSNSTENLNKLLEELTKYLYENHRLNLSSPKTKIILTSDFVRDELNNPDDVEKQEQHKLLTEIAKKMVEEEGYSNSFIDEIEINHLDTSKQFEVYSKTLCELLESMIKNREFDLGLMRHILKRARIKKCKTILPLVFDNFDFFIPTIREVCNYLDAVLNEKTIKQYKKEIHEILTKSEAINLSFVQFWMNWLISNKIKFIDAYNLRKFFSKQEIIWKIKQSIIQNNTTYINSLKIDYDSYNLWEKLLILQGMKILPKGQVKAFINTKKNGMKKSEEFMMQSILI